MLAISLNFATADEFGSLLAEEGFVFLTEAFFGLGDIFAELTLDLVPFLAGTFFFTGVFLEEAEEVTLPTTDFPLFALFLELETSGFFFAEDPLAAGFFRAVALLVAVLAFGDFALGLEVTFFFAVI